MLFLLVHLLHRLNESLRKASYTRISVNYTLRHVTAGRSRHTTHVTFHFPTRYSCINASYYYYHHHHIQQQQQHHCILSIAVAVSIHCH